MNKEALPGGLVLIKPIGSKLEPYTTAATVAEYAQVQGDTVSRLIRKQRKKRGSACGADVVGLLTADELAEVTKREAQVCALLDCGMKYEAIRDIVRPREATP